MEPRESTEFPEFVRFVAVDGEFSLPFHMLDQNPFISDTFIENVISGKSFKKN